LLRAIGIGGKADNQAKQAGEGYIFKHGSTPFNRIVYRPISAKRALNNKRQCFGAF
jgi:hypothetical protein